MHRQIKVPQDRNQSCFSCGCYTFLTRFSKVIGIDPLFSAKVLRLANSALFRFPAQIDNIARAVNVVGGEAIYM